MIAIRPATTADIPAILALETASPGAAHWDEQEYSRILMSNTAAERLVLVAEQEQADSARESIVSQGAQQLPPEIGNPAKLETRNSKLVLLGFIVARVVGPEWEIENIVVAARAMRRQLGTRLVCEIIELAQKRGGAAVHLEVRESNAAARALYEKSGFVRTGRRSDYYREPAEDALVYRLQLSEGALKTC